MGKKKNAKNAIITLCFNILHAYRRLRQMYIRARYK